MVVPFESLPETSRVWIYQSNERFTEEQEQEICEQLTAFLNQWVAHGQDLEAGFEIRYNRFIVIALNQAVHQATGCSIDSQVHFIQELEKKYQLDLLDQMNVAFKQGDFVNFNPLNEFRKIVKQGAVGKNTIVFNNLVTNKAEYTENWEVPMSDSWHARML